MEENRISVWGFWGSSILRPYFFLIFQMHREVKEEKDIDSFQEREKRKKTFSLCFFF